MAQLVPPHRPSRQLGHYIFLTMEPGKIFSEQIFTHLTSALGRKKNALLRPRAGSGTNLPADLASLSPSLGLSFPHLRNGNSNISTYHLTTAARSFLSHFVPELPLRYICAEGLGPAFL